MSSSQRTAVLKAIPGMIHPIVGHALTCLTDGCAVITDRNGILDSLLPATPSVEIYERINIPDVHTKAVSGHVVMGGIKTDIAEV